MSKQLSLIVPLLKYADAPPFAKALNKTYQGLDECIWQLFGHTAQTQLPIAALSYQYDIQTATKDHIIRADPVHLRLDRQAAYLLDAAFIHISTEESHALIQSINTYQNEFKIESNHPERWYIRQPQPLDLQTLRLEQIRGTNIATALPTGKDAPHWRQISNEIQMLLHDHPINQQRQQCGQAVINSLWFWGAGQLPKSTQSPWQQIFSQHTLTQALAQQQHISLKKPPKNAPILLKNLTEGATLLQLDLQQENQIPQWEQDWLIPLQQALIHKQIDSIDLYSTNKSYRLQTQSWLSQFFSLRLS